jgi:hypothetical protein
MKEIFYNSQGYNTVKITIESFNEKLDLYYHLNNNPVQYIWQEIHKNSKNFSMGISNAFDTDILINRLDNLCKKVGELKIPLPLTQENLNILHHKFVISQNLSNNLFSEEWLEINHLIHALESKIDEKLSKYKKSIIFYKNPENKIVPIKDEYKIWLTTERKWGKLLLGYGTLGKDWIDIATNNDDLTDLNIQSTISSETTMIFDLDYPFLFGDVQRFYQWTKKSNYVIPLNNLNKLSLGNYFLGEIIITDVFLDYHPNTSDWYVPNHKCKLDWGDKILGNNPKVKEIKFFNSDLYFDTLVKHSKLNV